MLSAPPCTPSVKRVRVFVEAGPGSVGGTQLDILLRELVCAGDPVYLFAACVGIAPLLPRFRLPTRLAICTFFNSSSTNKKTSQPADVVDFEYAVTLDLASIEQRRLRPEEYPVL